MVVYTSPDVIPGVPDTQEDLTEGPFCTGEGHLVSVGTVGVSEAPEGGPFLETRPPQHPPCGAAPAAPPPAKAPIRDHMFTYALN